MAGRTNTREIPEGFELRGHRLRLYPLREQVERMQAMQDEMRRAWNLLAGWRRAHLDACVARAERDGVVGPEPPKPEKSRKDDPSPDNAAAWDHYLTLAAERRRQGIDYALKNVAGYGFMRLGVNAWDYGALRSYAAPESSVCSAHQYQALIKNFIRAKRPRPRRPRDAMPLQVLSGKCYAPGGPPEPPNGRRGIRANVTISFAGMKLRGREHREPGGDVIEGVAITKETDGWYAAVRAIVPVRPVPAWTRDEAIGVALGLDVLCATSTGMLFRNIRRAETTAAVAEMQRGEVEAEDPKGSVWKYPDGSSVKISRQSERLQTQLSRRVRCLIEGPIFRYLAQFRWVIYAPDEDGSLQEMAQGKQTRLTHKGRGGYVSAMGLLMRKIQSLGPDRARAVTWVDISRTCSQCGEISKSSWAWRESPNGQCVRCGYIEHRRINTARNVLAKGLVLLNE